MTQAIAFAQIKWVCSIVYILRRFVVSVIRLACMSPYV
jgi:hypothetical protein